MCDAKRTLKNMVLSLLSVENIIYLKFALLKTYMTPWVVVFLTSTTTDKILSFIKSVSFRPAGRLVWIQEVEQCREQLPRYLNLY